MEAGTAMLSNSFLDLLFTLKSLGLGYKGSRFACFDCTPYQTVSSCSQTETDLLGQHRQYFPNRLRELRRNLGIFQATQRKV